MSFITINHRMSLKKIQQSEVISKAKIIQKMSISVNIKLI